MNELADRVPPVERIDAARLPEVVAVHCDAFFDYPTLRFVLGASDRAYPERLAALIESFLDSTLSKGGHLFGLSQNGELAAVADTVHSGGREPAELAGRREALWARLDAEARARYEAYCAVTKSFAPAAPHYYLSMLGVRRRYAGRGLARLLLEKVQALSRADPASTGVALETEEPRNVGLYAHFGYRLVGHGRVGEEIESWGFFRPDEG